MSQLSDYKNKYPEFAIERDDGVLHLRFHSEGRAFCWSAGAHRFLGDVLQDIDADPENRVLMLSGTGEDFCGSIALPTFKGVGWDVITWEGKRYLSALLNLEIPVIAAVQGRCTIHAEIPLLSDIVLCSDDAVIGDSTHFARNVVPGDGTHVLWTTLLGPNRGRHLLFAEELLNARQALALGVVGEVVAAGDLLKRAWEHARRIAAKPSVVARNTRTALIRPWKQAFDDGLAFGLALQGAAYGNRPHRGEVPVQPDGGSS
ncbi:MAG: enoyl-CoA hydratase/isomerase family protein [Burkholderiaceae bacterium]|nr:enoyl-CoA hydratase/isomerase family protein [Burkholderiaceae bacterium]